MATPKRTIREVLNLDTGEYLDAEVFFKDFDEVHKMRSELSKAVEGIRSDLLVCLYCKQKIAIRGGLSHGEGKMKTMYFAHLKDSDDCEIKTNTKLSKKEIEARKYNGQKESQPHIFLKEKIASLLNLSKDVVDVHQEKVIKSRRVDGTWRKPDVQATFKGKNIAFEIQLSTTWLSVITERQEFYKNEGYFMVWVFNGFNPDDDERKLAFNDVVFTNKQNAFVLDEDALSESKKKNGLVLKCFYKKYFVSDDELHSKWHSTFITLDDLEFDENLQKCYYYDSDKDKASALRNIDNLKEERRSKQEAALRKQQLIEERRKQSHQLDRYLNVRKSLKLTTRKKIDEFENEIAIAERLIGYRTTSIRENKSKLQNLDAEVKEAEKVLLGYSCTDSFHWTLREKFKDVYQKKRDEVIQKKTTLEEEVQKIRRIKAFTDKEFEGVSYKILDPSDRSHWGFITENFSKVYTINKHADLLNPYKLNSHESLKTLENHKFSNNFDFVYDFSEKLKNESDLQEQLDSIEEHKNAVLKDILLEVERYIKKHLVGKIEEDSNFIKEKEEEIVNLRTQELAPLERDMSKLDSEIEEFEKQKSELWKR